MARYRITITLNQRPQDQEYIVIDSPIGVQKFLYIFWDDTPPAGNGVEIDNTIVSTSYNLQQSHNFNYNGLGEYPATQVSNQVMIEGEFTLAPVIGSVLPVGTDVDIEEIAQVLVITSAVPEEHTADPCNYVDILITANKLFDELTSPFQATFPETLTYLIEEVPRGLSDTFVIRIKDSENQIASRTFPVISYLNNDVISLQVVNNTLIVSDVTNLTLQYSLDGQNWQDAGLFDGLTAGNYILYVKDQFGCQITDTFTIIEGDAGNIAIPEPYFSYSNANCIRMAKVEKWDNCGTFKNSKNSLSCQSADDVSYTEYQRYRDCDVINIQMKSNYPDLKVVTTDDDLEQALVQKSNNMGIKDSMDCKLVSLDSTYYGIYFIAGNTYDYDTGTNLNEPYVLNGNLPQFGRIGNIVTINNVNYTITNITFNEALGVDQLIIQSTSLGGISDTIIKAIYNIFDYEIYEVSVAMIGRTAFNIWIYYDEDVLQYVSENIILDNVSENLVHIAWSMDYNTDLFYATGIIPDARLLIDTIKAKVDNKGETYMTDTDALLIDSENYEVDVYKFLPLTKEMVRSVIVWLSSTNISINGISYTKDTLELEPLERSNLYVLTATLTLRGTGLFDDRVGSSNVELLELIKTEADEYIKIK